MAVTITVGQRGGVTYSSKVTVDLDLEGRLPPEIHRDLVRAVEDFVSSEWIERISRTF
jgi:hypothetical protein